MQDQKIQITWYGTASVRISAGNTSLLVDPFIPFPDSSVRLAADAYADCGHILITHGHYDHIGSIREIVRPQTAVYCTKAPYQSLRRMGVKPENLHLIGAGTVLHIGDFRITACQGSHIKVGAREVLGAIFCRRTWRNRRGVIGKILKFTSCREKKESLCYLVEGFGRRILIPGSLALADGVSYPVGADLMTVPYQGSNRLYDIAEGLYRRLLPKAILLTHFDDTFPPFSTDIDTAEFEKEMRRRTTVYKLCHGGSLEL